MDIQYDVRKGDTIFVDRDNNIYADKHNIIRLVNRESLADPYMIAFDIVFSKFNLSYIEILVLERIMNIVKRNNENYFEVDEVCKEAAKYLDKSPITFKRAINSLAEHYIIIPKLNGYEINNLYNPFYSNNVKDPKFIVIQVK